MKSIIFINYRREETYASAGRLADLLMNIFGEDGVFIDVDHIIPGYDFVEELNERVAESDIFLLVIGKRWLEVLDIDGSRRLDNPNDWVRVEIEAALTKKKHIIPVLVDGAEPIRAESLPASLAPIARRQAVRITPERFRADTNGLSKAIKDVRLKLASQPPQKAPVATTVSTSLPVTPPKEKANWLGFLGSIFGSPRPAPLPAQIPPIQAKTRLAESLWGDGNEVAHVDLMMGPRGSAAERAFANGFVSCSDGFTPMLAMLSLNLLVKPYTLVVNKVTMKGARQVVQMGGPVQYAVAKAVADSVAEGVIPLHQADDLFICVSAFVHWEAHDDKRLVEFNYLATKEAIARAMRGKPTVEQVLSERVTARHPFAAT